MEEREFATWVLSLEPDEFYFLSKTMDASEWLELNYIIYEIKDEMITDWMDEYGCPDAEILITYLQKKPK